MADLRVLVLDDEPGLAKITARVLEKRGFQAEPRDDPEACLELLRENPKAFDVFIVDFLMPSMNGSEFIESARQCGVEAGFILLTGVLDDSVRIVEESELVQIATKPIGIDKLEVLIRKCYAS